MTRIVQTLAVALALVTTSPWGQFVAGSQTDRPFRDPVLSAIAAAAEMPALESTVLPPGYREIRIRSEESMVCCYARPMLRLVEGPGEVRGSLWLFRTLVLRPGNPGPRDDERCEPVEQQHICVRPWNLTSGNWAAVSAKLEQLGAWVLANPCNRPTIVHNDDGTTSGSIGVVGDSGVLSVQRRVGLSMSGFLCIGPRHEREVEGLKANALYEYFIGLNGVIPTEFPRIAR